MEIHANTDVGRVRDTNEDTVLTESFERASLLVVADGMGGHAAGDVASRIATETIRDRLSDNLPIDPTEYESILDKAIIDANRSVQAEADGPQSGMGTTVVVALVTDGKAVIGNVGDSRAYHVHDTIEQVTVDQSLVQKLVEEGTITEAEAEDHPQSNVVSQALGTTETVEPDFYRLDIEGTLLLCSDGLSDEVSDQTISELVADTPDLESAAEQLVQTANDNGGGDNISIALCSV